MDMIEKMIGNSLGGHFGTGERPDRRRSSRPPAVRTSHTSLTSHLWELELLPPMAIERLTRDIDDLTQRALEPNVFFGSAVLRAAWPRLTTVLAPQGAMMLCLWETFNEARHLRLFVAVKPEKTGLPGCQVLQTLSNEFMPIGTPLIDAECAGEATETLLRLLADPKLDVPCVFDLTHQYDEGPAFQSIIAAAKSLGLKSEFSNQHMRAAITERTDKAETADHLQSKRRRRELARQLRLMSKDGTVRFDCASSTNQVLDAFEHFMTVELQGWKGRSGTALYNHKRIASFSRQIVAELAAIGNCKIYSLVLTRNKVEETVATIIFLGTNGHYVPWKMAYNEKYSAFSPGMQLMAEATRHLMLFPDFIKADSLAPEDHWMMNNVWPDRIGITDCTIALAPAGHGLLAKTAKAKRRYAALRNRMKAALKSLRQLTRV